GAGDPQRGRPDRALCGFGAADGQVAENRHAQDLQGPAARSLPDPSRDRECRRACLPPRRGGGGRTASGGGRAGHDLNAHDLNAMCGPGRLTGPIQEGLISMKLYFATGACSQASRISLHEAGLAADFERVDLKTKITEHGSDYKAINPKGYVPMLVLDDGLAITETLAVLDYIRDR